MTDKIKVFKPTSWLGNSYQSKIIYHGEHWNSVESLFQAMRFNDETIRQRIREEKNASKARLLAYRFEKYRTVEPLSAMDIENLRTAMFLKFDQHIVLRTKLLATADAQLIQESSCFERDNDLYWSMINVEGQWVGDNKMGKILMEIRQKHLHYGKT
jgi:ribA/ribD-fused uncharacterized protein